MKTGIELIAEERTRQIEVEGWTPEHDKLHQGEQLAQSAACYAIPQKYRNEKMRDGLTIREFLWDWSKSWWKPSPKNRIKELVKAGALIAAEIDRLQNKDKEGEN